MRSDIFKRTTGMTRDLIIAWVNNECRIQWENIQERYRECEYLAEEARVYRLDSLRDRNYAWEEQFVKDYQEAWTAFRQAAQGIHNCEEWHKIIYGEYYLGGLPGHQDATHIIRLVQSNRAGHKELEDVVEKKIIPAASGEQGVAPATQSSSTHTAAQVGKAEKKAVGDEVKKNDEKGKDATNVENS
jgi:hypothetical protein